MEAIMTNGIAHEQVGSDNTQVSNDVISLAEEPGHETVVVTKQTDPSSKEVKAVKKKETEIKKHGLFEGAQFFHTPNLDPYVAVDNGDRVEVCPIISDDCELLIARDFHIHTGGFPSAEEIAKIKFEMKWYAKIAGVKANTHIRYAGEKDVVYVDLCNDNGDLVEITAEGWQIKRQGLKPPFFMRYPGMLPLPYPEKGGDIAELADFMNVRCEEDFILMAGFVLGAMNPQGPFPTLICHGPQGSGKSMTLRMISELIDPSESTMATLPSSERDLFIAASRSWLLRYDNVSKLTPVLSDAFCRLCTEGVFRTRKLYTNTQETILRARRPSIFNGISEFAHQNDLLDRAISLTFPPIPTRKRKLEKSIRADWGAAKPRLLGAFYNALSMSLRNRGEFQLKSAPRMADFVHGVIAAEKACPWEPGAFLEAYDRNRNEMIERAIEADPTGEAVVKLMQGQNVWQGVPTELFKALRAFASEENMKLPEWPKAPSILSNRLQRLQGFLSNKGIEIERRRQADNRFIILTKTEEGEAGKGDAQSDTPPDTNTAEGLIDPSKVVDEAGSDACFFSGEGIAPKNDSDADSPITEDIAVETCFGEIG